MLLQGTAPLGLAPEAPCAVKKAKNRFQVRYAHRRCFSDSAGGDSYLSCLSDL